MFFSIFHPARRRLRKRTKKRRETVDANGAENNESKNTGLPEPESSNTKNDGRPSNGVELAPSEFTPIEWIDLMPEDDLNALLNPPEYIAEIEEGTEDDQIDSQIRQTLAASSEDRYQQALVSTSVRKEMNGKAIRIPGFIVPVEFNDEQIVTQFFLVPFFGACIHMPPPPPNQIIFVSSTSGLKLQSLFEPFWISGKLSVSLTENELATSAYSMDMLHHEPFSE